ncbi:MAG: hypothetical protein LQ352_001671 [Teloschistes flavicans]|nr:MAG: hypothetical protein LQ352_001671 [Teloschistes flavicans]
MNLAASLKRPAVSLTFLYPTSFQRPIPIRVDRRHQSSARRTTKRLRVKPDPSLVSSIPPKQLRDHVIFNPPSSSPSPYHTPLAFLPPSDPRRALLVQSHEHDNPHAQADKHLPPPAFKISPPKRYHLKEDDIRAIRKLRLEDPLTWSRKKLAQRFDCSEWFVASVCNAPSERKAQHEKELEEIRARWGNRRRYAREDRQKRREMWGRDE